MKRGCEYIKSMNWWIRCNSRLKHFSEKKKRNIMQFDAVWIKWCQNIRLCASPFNNVGWFVCCMINYLNKIPVCIAVGIQGWHVAICAKLSIFRLHSRWIFIIIAYWITDNHELFSVRVLLNKIYSFGTNKSETLCH